MRFRSLLATMLMLGACAGPSAGVRIPALASPQALAGVWTLTVEGVAACKLLLTAAATPQGYRASPQGGCSVAVAQWRPVPDGLEIADSSGLTLVLLEPASPDAFQGFDAARRPARLVR